jgi:hypothetical protein
MPRGRKGSVSVSQKAYSEIGPKLCCFQNRRAGVFGQKAVADKVAPVRSRFDDQEALPLQMEIIPAHCRHATPLRIKTDEI